MRSRDDDEESASKGERTLEMPAQAEREEEKRRG